VLNPYVVCVFVDFVAQFHRVWFIQGKHGSVDDLFQLLLLQTLDTSGCLYHARNTLTNINHRVASLIHKKGSVVCRAVVGSE
jgi:hypothetical protein